MSTDQPICLSCKHYDYVGLTKELQPICKAFPKGIPEDIFWEVGTHSKPTKDQDNDIVFELIEVK